ncbi:Uncharacterized protein MCB1EB_0538 [Mycoavidus cysteinexigens]|uniref:Uncharacterized protein n=1 Tax=Mycoavidus cysteinexigens TaxID=1553431 RepID=A0A2Z6ETF3_9BURK|nr:hypothetical protein [Mycoavidus cysteinexigens]BBE08699.1 Uncharacterized protein MCB1EB_0538 [Mycoavidus cysteinexigens]GAM52588.1 hypothetical protein EBME_1051 [bacterium endosymbiont of Mortierella elongata FMR23-6]GLR01439.1 hypothetical protein GCM10007934_12510 [Mycoavidus cysteinexigens]
MQSADPTQSSKPDETKKQKQEAGCNYRNQFKNQEKLHPDWDTFSKYEKAAARRGFFTEEGMPDKARYNRLRTQRDAGNIKDKDGKPRFVDQNGVVDTTAYRKYLKQLSAKKFTRVDGSHPFQEADGSGNTQKYRKYVKQYLEEKEAVFTLIDLKNNGFPGRSDEK